MNVLKKIVYRIRGDYTTEQLVKRGLKIGDNFNRENEVIIDSDHCWMIEIGNNVTLAPRVHILCHDASTKNALGYTKIGRVIIKDNVFIGAGTIILPGVTIGKDVIIGANSTVTHDVPDGVVVAGTPLTVLCSTKDYIAKEEKRMQERPCYGEEYTLRGDITEERKALMIKEAERGISYVR